MPKVLTFCFEIFDRPFNNIGNQRPFFLQDGRETRSFEGRYFTLLLFPRTTAASASALSTKNTMLTIRSSTAIVIILFRFLLTVAGTTKTKGSGRNGSRRGSGWRTV